MNVLIKRRQIIMAALIVVLGAAVFVNWYFTNYNSNLGGDNTGATGENVQNLGEAQLVGNKSDTSSSSDAVSLKEYFAQIKLNRKSSREDAMDNINAVLDSAEVDSKLAQSVAQSLDKLVATIEVESAIETLVSAKLGCECVAVYGDKTVQVIVEKGKMTDDAVLQIKDIVLKNSDIPADGITILEAGQ